MIPACITARASRTCPDACRDRLPAGAGKTFPAFPAHAHPQFYVSGERPMFGTYSPSGYFSKSCWYILNCDLNKMADFLQTTFYKVFSRMEMFHCSVNAVVPNKCQAITWSNEGWFNWRSYGLPSLNELRYIQRQFGYENDLYHMD